MECVWFYAKYFVLSSYCVPVAFYIFRIYFRGPFVVPPQNADFFLCRA